MKVLRRSWLVVIGLALGLPVLAKEDAPDEAAPDVPVRVEKDLFHPPVRLAAADGVIDSGPSWGHASPWVVDLDGRGVKDLVVGDFSGLFRVYRNLGTNEKPRYARPVNLQAGGVDAKVPIY
jgi:hypothetical protein